MKTKVTIDYPLEITFEITKNIPKYPEDAGLRTRYLLRELDKQRKLGAVILNHAVTDFDIEEVIVDKDSNEHWIIGS